jgi:hypothetical protein
MVTFEALKAKHGDSLLLHYADKDGPRLIVIDGGPPGVFNETLKLRLAEIHDDEPRKLPPNKPLDIDLMMVSHIDEDHIAGLLDLMNKQKELDEGKKPLPFNIRKFWHNSFDDVIGNTEGAAVASAGMAAAVAESASVGQGRNLRKLISAFKLDGNKPVGGLVMLGGAKPGADISGMKLTIIGPPKENVEALQETWDKEIKPILKKEKAGKGAEVAAFVDTAVPNLSSIVVMAEIDNKRILLTGDANGRDILAGLEKTNFIQPNGKMEVDILKLPHHGSDRNVAPEFFERIHAKHYVVSADGKFNNPDIDTLKMISDARPDDQFTIHLTNPPNEFVLPAVGTNVQEFFDAEKAKGRKYSVVQRKTGERSIRITL